nr:chondroitin proteoglycan 2-like isoform X2 [Onthophagus taurus]
MKLFITIQILLVISYSFIQVSTSEVNEECVTEINCERAPDGNQLKRHPTDCRKSYKCVNGEARIYSCEANKYFIDDLQSCEVPEDTTCNVICIETETPEISPESRPEIHCDMNEYCKSNPTENSLKRHPTDCTKSFRCANGEARIYSCPSNQHFYADIQACDVPKDEECTIDALECTLTTTEAEIESTTAAIQPESRPEIHCDMKIYCKNGPTETTLKRHPTDCTKSFRCANGEARIYSCPPNQHFFTELQICDVPKTEQCEIEAIKCGNTATEAPIEITTIDIQPTPKPEDQCNINMHCKFSPNEDGFRRHPADCTKYYRCVDGYPIIFSCSMNQQFYTDSQMCHISNNQCNINCVHDTTEVETTTVIQTTTSIPTTTVIPTTTLIPTTTVIPTTTESQTTTESSDEDLECDISRCPDISFDEVAYLRHKDCTKYCLCHGSLIYTLSCGDMLHFNLDLKTCDWPNNAGCAK